MADPDHTHITCRVPARLQGELSFGRGVVLGGHTGSLVAQARAHGSSVLLRDPGGLQWCFGDLSACWLLYTGRKPTFMSVVIYEPESEHVISCVLLFVWANVFSLRRIQMFSINDLARKITDVPHLELLLQSCDISLPALRNT